MGTGAPLRWAENEILVSLGDRSSLASEQFRRMRIRLDGLKETLGGTMRVILITSPMMNEGKTATAMNLALSLAQGEGRKVVLVDCDVRKAGLERYFIERPAAGLAEALGDGAPLEKVVSEVEGSSLHVIGLAKGSDRRVDPVPIERLKTLLKDLRSRYDFVVCDAPPVLPVADTAALARLADGVVLVVRAEFTPRDAVARSLAVVEKTKIIGLVLNAVSERNLERYYYGYHAEDVDGGGSRNGGRK
jgi:capsular exopolysaccharide synthesis family protein